jgi:hypothetical protein
MIATRRNAPAVIAAIKAQVTAMVLDDTPAKVIAVAIDRSVKNTCGWITSLGFRRMYVTAEERAHLMARRATEAKRK